MNNFEHITDFTIPQLSRWIENHLGFPMSGRVDIEAAFAFADFMNQKVDEMEDSRLWSLELCGLKLEYLGVESPDGKLWAATFHAVAECDWFEKEHIYKYPASFRAATSEEVILRAAAIAGAMLISD